MTSRAEASLSTEQVSVGWTKDSPVLCNVNLSLGTGVHCIVGPNGSGKTTLVRTLAGILPPLTGAIHVHGRIGYLSHRPGVYPQLTVEENLRQWATILDPDKETPIPHLMEQFGITAIAAQRASTLSQGQRQRLGIARSLLGAPSILFLDEPTAGMDPPTQETTHEVISELGRNACILVTSHDLLAVSRIATGILKVSSSGNTVYEDMNELTLPSGRTIRLSVPHHESDLAMKTLVPGTAKLLSSGWIAVQISEDNRLAEVLTQLENAGVEIKAVDDLGGLTSYYRK